MPKQEPKKMHWLTPLVVSAVFAAVLLVIANSAIWVNRYFFNTQNFTHVASESLLSESSRQAMAQEITNRALADRPVAKQLLDDTSVKVISGILGGDRVKNAFNDVVSRLHVAFTSNDQQSIVINLEGPKQLLTNVVNVVETRRDVQFDPQTMPSELVLLDASKIPDFYKAGVVFLWLGPLAFIGAVVLLVYPYVKKRDRYKTVMIVQGATVALAGCLALLLGPLFRPPLLARVESSDVRVVVSNLYNAFVDTFNMQTAFLIGLGLVALLVGAGLMLATVIKKQKA